MTEFTTNEVIAASASAHRINKGFIKKDQIRFDKKYEGHISNSQQLYRHFFEGKNLEITDQDRALAEEIIDYLKGLSFKAIERTLTDFEKNVLTLVTGATIKKEQIGIAASLPKVYLNKVEQDAWTSRESELSRTSMPLGTINTREDFIALIEFVRYIPKTMSYLVTASVNGKHILKFFSPKLIKINTTVEIAGFIKSQAKGRYHAGHETLINRVKFKEDEKDSSVV